MPKKIESREDVKLLIHTFYKKIQIDSLLGPIFNAIIPTDNWPAHLSKLTDFWETNLFGIAKFKGNPSLKHVLVDHHMNHQMSQDHFERWLSLWAETVTDLFEGDLAEKAIYASQNMAVGQMNVVLRSR